MKKIDTKEVLFDRCPYCGSPATYELCGRIEGGDAEERYGTSWIRVGCERCGAQMDVWADNVVDPTEGVLIGAAQARWNRRDGFPKRPTIYISGAITNDPNYVAKFAKVEAKLREMGFEPINPAKTDLGEGATYKEYLDHGLAQLMQADVICRIIEHKDSLGAAAEIRYAEAAKILAINVKPNEEGEVEAF